MKKIIMIVLSILLTMFLVTAIETKSTTSKSNGNLEEKITVYSTYNEDVLNFLKDEFKAKTSVNIEFKSFNSDKELENSIREEVSNPKADFILGGTSTMYSRLTKENLLQKNYPTWCSDIDGNEKDKDGYWYGTSKTPLTLFYNSDVIKAAAIPTSLVNLSDPKYKGLVGLNNLDSESSKYFIGSIMEPYYKENKVEDGYKLLLALKANIKDTYDGDKKVIEAVESKDIAVGFAPLNVINYSKEKNKTPINVISESDSFVMLTQGVAVINGCNNPNSAKLFEEFAAGPKMQLELAKKFAIIPTHKIALKNSDDWLKNINGKNLKVDLDSIEANIAVWIEKWNSLVIEAPKVNPIPVTRKR